MLVGSPPVSSLPLKTVPPIVVHVGAAACDAELGALPLSPSEDPSSLGHQLCRHVLKISWKALQTLLLTARKGGTERRQEVQELNGRKAGGLEGGLVKGKPVAAFDADAENEARLAAMVCSLKNKDECLMCGS